MVNRYDVCVSEKGKDDKTYYTNIGVAFVSEKGHISIKLKAHPIGGDMVLFPAKPKEARGPVRPGGNEYPADWDEGL
jgi:hypothetical protein